MMPGYLTNIKTKIPYSHKKVDINLNGRTLILVGSNGCGKTQLLNYVYKKLTSHLFEGNNYKIEHLQQNISGYQRSIEQFGPQHPSYESWVRSIQEHELLMEELDTPPINLSSLEDFRKNYNEFRAVLLQFEAGRKSDILKPSSVNPIKSLIDKDRNQGTGPLQRQTTSSLFEEFLMTSITNQAFSESHKIHNNPEEAERIEQWFKKLQADLRSLFEDDELRLVFKSDTFSFEINQPNKEPFTFQTLSSGFSSIMAVYADLVTKVSLRSIGPEDLTGIVMIDEIDAHLHVSLQKKILPFLTRAFPKVQFIVTTHSPFVVSSVNDSVIYDLSKLEQVEDLSMYSYEAVLEGLFGVLPISNLLQKNVEILAHLLETRPIDVEKIQRYLNDLLQSEDSLDSESLYFVNSAKLAINKAKRK